jgi:hypothetical protein
MPIELMRFAAGQAQAGQTAKEARRGIEHFRQQGVANMPRETGVAARFAQGLRQTQDGSGESLLGGLQCCVRERFAFQRRGPCEATMLSRNQQHGGSIQASVRHAFLRHDLEKETEHSMLLCCGDRRPDQ